MRILLFEENGNFNENDRVQKGLKQYGYTVDRLSEKDSLRYIKKESFEVILLDLSLSQIESSIVREIRAKDIKTPILILNSFTSTKNKVQTFDSGADDYLIKPVDLDELSARIRALQRRFSNNRASPLLTYRDIELNLSSLTVTLKGKIVSFSRHEFSLLQKLLENVGRVVSRNSLNQCLYGWVNEIDSNTLEVYVHNIRKKLKNTQLIQTIRGIGYKVVKESV